MRAIVVAIVACAACTPEVVSGAYRCGPDSSCPEGQVCNGPDAICVDPGIVLPFSCEPEIATEPDDSAELAHVIDDLDCTLTPISLDSCMPDGDGADWVRFVAPTGCAARDIDARVQFSVAFQRLALELWDLDANNVITEDAACTTGGAVGLEQRCLRTLLTPGTAYGLQVVPAGDGNCDGECAFNRYTLQIQLVLPR